MPSPSPRQAAALLLSLALAACGDAPARSWHVDVTAPSLSAVAWSGTGYAAAGYLQAGGSPDGVAWTWSDLSKPVSGLCWTGREFLAVGLYGAAATSTDGRTWTDRSVDDGALLFDAVASNGVRAVAVGNGPVVWSSDDLAGWTAHDLGGPTVLSGVTFTGQGFVAVGHLGFAGAVATSPDGLSWTLQQPLVAGSMASVAWSGSRLVAVGDSIYTSADGLTWEAARHPAGMGFLHAVTWTGRDFLAVGERGTILRSTDGLGWAEEASGVDVGLLGVAGGPGSAVAVSATVLLSWR